MNRIVRTLTTTACVCILAACQTMPGPGKPRIPTAPPPAETPATDATTAPPAVAPVPPAPTFLQPEPGPITRGDELFDRLVQRFADAPCVRDHLAERWQGTYARSPTHLAAEIAAILPLMALALEEAERYRMPGELVLLPIVESWYRPDAGAGRGHVGLWQFGAPTARGLGLQVGRDYDARMAPLASTDAAMRHLADLHNRFGDWKLANMGFNAGPYRLQKVLEKTRSERISASDRQPPGLSPITYEHLAKVQALACLIAKPARFGLELPRDAAIVPLTPVMLPPGASTLGAIAARTGTDATMLARFNPAFRRGVVSASAGRELLVPHTHAARFAQLSLPTVAPAAVAASSDATGSHVIRRGDTLGAIARHYRLRLRDLLAWNGLNPRSILRPGQRIKLEP
jgi:membrane-bound lytic murein transglycosylase D